LPDRNTAISAIDPTTVGSGPEFAVAPATDLATVQDQLSNAGFCFLPAASTRALLGWADRPALSADWNRFCASWDQMPVDAYMADMGRYRRRRHAVLRLTDGVLSRPAHQPHFQSTDYNPLNGGIERWFEPIPASVVESAQMRAILALASACFASMRPSVRCWKLELHQFRIEARADEPGQPTPEGSHRDGVDFVLVLLTRRQNIARGCTSIHRPDGQALGEFTLTEPLDAALVDDQRVFHGVTAVEALDPAMPSYRDVLVITFKADSIAAAG
jgi:hypothetical protein